MSFCIPVTDTGLINTINVYTDEAIEFYGVILNRMVGAMDLLDMRLVEREDAKHFLQAHCAYADTVLGLDEVRSMRRTVRLPECLLCFVRVMPRGLFVIRRNIRKQYIADAASKVPIFGFITISELARLLVLSRWRAQMIMARLVESGEVYRYFVRRGKGSKECYTKSRAQIVRQLQVEPDIKYWKVEDKDGVQQALQWIEKELQRMDESEQHIH